MEIAQFHYITQEIESSSHETLAAEACEAGAKWVQLRVKDSPYNEWKATAIKVKEICDQYKAKLIINDSVRITKEIGAHGVHLGKYDMPPLLARKILSDEFIIGGTANTTDDLYRLRKAKVDYAGIGPYAHTTTKQNLSDILGLDGVRVMSEAFDQEVPMIVIGGVQPEDVPLIMELGVSGVAVASAVNLASDRKMAVKAFLEKIEKSIGHVHT